MDVVRVHCRVVKDTSIIEKIVVLVDSIYAQSQYNIGRNALVVIQKILKNTASVIVNLSLSLCRTTQSTES